MTSPTPMTREELLELAALDAFGLLDEYEAALYTRSFHHAPVAVQNEIKELQAAFAHEASLLPDVEPDPALRQRVLDAVARAIEAESMELAPLAMIGRPDRARNGTAGRMGLGAATPVWRAAAFALAAALLVVAYFAGQFLERNNQMTGYVIGLLTHDQIEEAIKPNFRDFLADPSCAMHVLQPSADGIDAVAAVFVNERTGEAFFFALRLPVQSDPFVLRATDDSGEPVSTWEFSSTSAVTGVRLGEISLALTTALTWEVVDATSTVLLHCA
jgi:hypothetical protein